MPLRFFYGSSNHVKHPLLDKLLPFFKLPNTVPLLVIIDVLTESKYFPAKTVSVSDIGTTCTEP